MTIHHSGMGREKLNKRSFVLIMPFLFPLIRPAKQKEGGEEEQGVRETKTTYTTAKVNR
jgi:hypothetical protein